jgi:hypothetical protein
VRNKIPLLRGGITMTSGPEQARLEYWKEGERRKLRVFMSHRWDTDDADLYGKIFKHLGEQGFSVQDLSLAQDQKVSGPRGGSVADMKISREIAARIYSSDILLVPSRVGAGLSDWIKWEVELASIAYDIPVLLIDHTNDIQRRSFVAELNAINARFEVVGAQALEIAYAVATLVFPPYQAVEVKATAPTRLYRGPRPQILHDVMNRFPYEPYDRLGG